MFAFAPVLMFLLYQKHLSAMVISGVLLVILLFIGGTKLIHLMIVGGAGIGAGIVYALGTGFRKERLMMFLDPWQDATDKGWQIIQSLYAIATGGFFGAGLGQGVQKYMYISEPQNDFIFATWAEEMGLLGVLFVMALFVIFIWRGIKIASNAQDLFGTLLAIGITSMVGIQAILNIAVVSASIPVTGISLPFCSYGGTSILVLLIGMGLLLSVSRFSKKKEVQEIEE